MKVNKTKIAIIVTSVVVLFSVGFYFIKKAIGKGGNSILKNSNPKKILIVGDSVSAVKNYQSGGKISYTYPNILKSELEPKGFTVDVLAKGGETTAWMLKNLPSQLSLKKYDRIYIQGGCNDAINLVDYSKFVSNVNKMIDLSKQNGADVYVLSGFDQEKTLEWKDIVTTKYVPTKQGMMDRFKIWFGWQKKIQNEFKDKANTIPLFEIPIKYVPDGLHPNLKGARYIADKIISTI